jgi:Ca2+-binding EF-hand superfamily protein
LIRCRFTVLVRPFVQARNGQIQYTEFLAATLEAQGRIDEYRIAEAFDQIDSDDTGYISKENLSQILGRDRSNPAGQEDYIDRLIEEMDEDGDGKVSYEEFKDAFAKAVDKNVNKMVERSESCASA